MKRLPICKLRIELRTGHSIVQNPLNFRELIISSNYLNQEDAPNKPVFLLPNYGIECYNQQVLFIDAGYIIDQCFESTDLIFSKYRGWFCGWHHIHIPRELVYCVTNLLNEKVIWSY